MPPTVDILKPTLVDVRYGPRERNLMAVWLAESDQPAPVVIIYHPGGFRLTSKKAPPRPGPIKVKKDILGLVRAGISVVAPCHDGAMMEPFEDAVRALQFVRANASGWNLDAGRVAVTGTSSGGCLSLWLGYHKDMAERESEDPVARQSSRPSCVAVNQAFSSVNPSFIGDLMPGSDVHAVFCRQFYGVDIDGRQDLPDETLWMMNELSPINHVDSESPPTLLRYDRCLESPYDMHHPTFGLALKQRMDEKGGPCDLVAGGKAVLGSSSKTVPTFIKQHLLKS